MSAENVAVVRRMYEDFGRGDIPGEAVADNVLGVLPDIFDEFAVEPLAFHDAGDVVVVEGRASGTSKAGGKLDAPVAWVLTVRDGKAVRNADYHDTNAWREALGG
jgi:ketosteroid isomerase-like protein